MNWIKWMCAVVLVASTGLQVSHAMENHSEVLRDQFGRAIVGARVTVNIAGTNTLATIFSDNGLTQKSNPFLTDAFDGRYNFYAANGTYDIIYFSANATFDAAHTKRIALFDMADFTGGGGGGGGGGAPAGQIQGGIAFPDSPANNFQFFLLSDSATGDCEAGGGTARTLCIYDGAQWIPVNYAPSSETLNTVTSRGNTSTGNDETNPLEVFGTGTQSGNGLVLDRTSSGESRIRCKETAGINKCHYYRQLDAGFKAGYKDSSGNIDFEYDEATGEVTVASIDVTRPEVKFTYVDERHFRVATCQNATASATFDLPATNAPTPTCNTESNTQKAYLAFDQSTDQSFQDGLILPNGFISIAVSLRWKAAATTGSVGWCAQLVRVPDGGTSNPAFPAQGAGNCVSDITKGGTLQENVATISNVTCSSCVAGDHVYVRISRDADGGAVTDDMAGNALLLTYGRAFTVEQ